MRTHHARSYLFVPASRPERLKKALTSGADRVIVDLEDAVDPECKDEARHQLEDLLAALTPDLIRRVEVRLNATDTRWHDGDVTMLTPWIERGLGGVVVPKAADVCALRDVAGRLGPLTNLAALVESLEGLDAVNELATTPQVRRLVFGHLDFQLDMGMACTPDEPELIVARHAIVAASRRARLPPPVDGVTTAILDHERLVADTQRARAGGFGAKLCIHPAQVPIVNGVLSPTSSDVEWARRVLAHVESHGEQAFSLDGRMVDLPVIRQARSTIRQYRPSDLEIP